MGYTIEIELRSEAGWSEYYEDKDVAIDQAVQINSHDPEDVISLVILDENGEEVEW